MEKFTANEVFHAIATLLAIATALAVFAKAIEIIKGWGQPHREVKAQLKKHEEMFARDLRRLDKHEAEIEKSKEGQRCLCAGVQALLEHQLHNGNTEGMQLAAKDINKWLRDGV